MMVARERVVLNFHGIGEPSAVVPADEVLYWCPSDLWPRLADAIVEARSIGDAVVEVTFDDGNLSDVEQALPALLERNLSATFFVCAGRIGRPGYLGPEGLRSLLTSGMRVGSHGFDHVDLRSADASVLRRETRGSADVIGSVTGMPVEDFALPFGSYDRRVLSALRGYRSVFTSDRGRAGDGWLVPRESYVRSWGTADIISLTSGRDRSLVRLRRRAARLVKSLR